jgi:SAM-dependent methyltransferase
MQKKLFDRKLIAKRLAAKKTAEADFITQLIYDDLHQRLAPISRSFDNAIIIAPEIKFTPKTSKTANSTISFSTLSTLTSLNDKIAIDPDNIILPKNNPKNNYDLIVSILDLQIINNVERFLKNIRHSLAPDGLLLIAAIGGNSFKELRSAWLMADEEILGGVYSRIAPLIDIKDAGSLLQNAGFALPVADIDHHIVRYANPLKLMQEIKQLGASNPLAQRPNRFVTKKHLNCAIKHYEKIAKDADGRIRASLDILWLSGWSPHESQQKPLKPGSAKTSLAKALHSKI